MNSSGIGLLDRDSALRAVSEAAAMKKLFRSWAKSREGVQIIGNLFQVFGGTPNPDADGLAHARFSGRQDVLHYILRHGALLEGGENGQ
ncbi:MAG: hypothetical protein LBT98_03385 [Puniceicoccales bacterium]|nr:hypothetical protein [Puniceicoccales bacterium]